MTVTRTQVHHRDVGPFAPDAYPHFAADPRAACKGTNPDMWFPPPNPDPQQMAALRMVCRRCVLRDTCLGWAVGQAWLDGVWAGTTRKQRALVRRAAARADRLVGVAA